MILGIDTSLGTAVALIERDGLVRAEDASANPLGHAEVIGTMIADAIAPTTGSAISHVAAGMGPGPYTGLRVGIVAARTFALARGAAVVPVPSHAAVALAELLAAEVAGGGVEPFAVVTDARRRELAYTIYDGLDEDGLPRARGGAALAPVAELDGVLAAAGVRRLDAASLSAAMLATCAARALAAGRTLAADEPLYLRSPDVQQPGAPKRVG